jgi:hypothetical protein
MLLTSVSILVLLLCYFDINPGYGLKINEVYAFNLCEYFSSIVVLLLLSFPEGTGDD